MFTASADMIWCSLMLSQQPFKKNVLIENCLIKIRTVYGMFDASFPSGSTNATKINK